MDTDKIKPHLEHNVIYLWSVTHVWANQLPLRAIFSLCLFITEWAYTFFYIVLHFTFVLLESELTLVALSKLKSLAFFVELYVNIKYECIDSLSRPAADRQLFFEVGTFS